MLAVLYMLAWRRGRAAASTHKPTYGTGPVHPGLLVILIALLSPIDGLGDQLLVMHMVQHVLLLDIGPDTAYPGGSTRSCCDRSTRRLHALERRAGYLAHPVFAVLAYAGFHVGLAHPGAVRRGAAQLRRPRLRAPVLLGRRGRCTGGTCCPRSAAACGSAAWARSGRRSPASSWSGSWGSRWRSLPRRSTPFTSTIRTTGACPSQISRWPAW